MPYLVKVHTVVETPVFSRKVEKLLSEREREEFAVFISQNPTSGAVISRSGGLRKIRWSRPGVGKSGGVRVIYYNQLERDENWLLTLYAKSERSTIPAHELNLIREAIEHG